MSLRFKLIPSTLISLFLGAQAAICQQPAKEITLKDMKACMNKSKDKTPKPSDTFYAHGITCGPQDDKGGWSFIPVGRGHFGDATPGTIIISHQFANSVSGAEISITRDAGDRVYLDKDGKPLSGDVTKEGKPSRPPDLTPKDSRLLNAALQIYKQLFETVIVP